MTHYFSQECKNSADLLCDHESLIAMQYHVEQTKGFINRMSQPQWHRNELFMPLEFDTIKSCDVNASKNRSLLDFNIIENSAYVQPCMTPTFTNSLVCTQEQCCSKTHQLFSNHTRSGTGRQS